MRLERNIAQEEKRKKKKRKKRILYALIFVLVLVVTAEIAVLLNMTTVDRTFLRDVERGVHDGWELSHSETELQTTGRLTDTAFIDKELEAISEYRGKPFKDKELEKLAKSYMSALRECAKAARNNDPAKDFDKFWQVFSVPYGKRIRALYGMHANEDYRINLGGKGFEEDLDQLLIRGWALDRTEGLEFIRKKNADGTYIYRARLKNDSGYDIDMLDIQIELYNAKGKIVETVSVHEEDIADRSRVTLSFWSAAGKAAGCRIAGVSCTGHKNRE